MEMVLGVAPQEAYYWNYARHLDLSYFDHPPMTAYLIHLFTTIFGSNTFGVHFSAIFISFILALLLFNFLKLIFDYKTAFWSVIIASTTFIFALGGLIITPDGPLLLFWMLMMFSLYIAVQQDSLGWWLLTGIFAGCAMLSKYPAVLAIIGALFYMLFSPERRRYLARPGPYLAAIVSLIVFLPVVIWNYRHDWASFAFQGGRRISEAVNIRADYFFGFLGSQIGVLGIFLIPLFIWALIKAYRYIKSDSRIALFFWFSVPTLALFTLVSPVHYVKMNWLAPAYLSILPAAVYLYFKSDGRFLKLYGRFAIVFSIAATLIIHILVLLPGFGFGKADTINGWKELAERVDKIKTEFPADSKPFICGYEYKTASELRFYLAGQPETFSNNVVGKPGLAYDFWSDPDTLIGKDCIFVYDKRNSYNGARPLQDFFEKVDSPEILTVSKSGHKITDFYIYKCFEYRGKR
jgi:4-amino-4-deoxy-L-arabinose transferase-like glycosyltransferase